MNVLRDAVAYLFITVACCSCRTVDNSAEVKVLNGVETAAFPAVVQIQGFGSCTATFVSPTTLLTAAHCLASTQPQTSASLLPIDPENDPISPQLVFTFGIVGQAVLQLVPFGHPGFDTQVFKDFAVLVFAEPLTNEVAKLATQAPLMNSLVTQVGFGASTFVGTRNSSGKVIVQGGGGGVKRAAVNQARITGGNSVAGSIFVEGTSSGSAALPGDSGGPLFVGDHLVGIASSLKFESSAVGEEGVHEFIPSELMNVYVDLSDARIQELMRTAVQNGAAIPGIE